MLIYHLENKIVKLKYRFFKDEQNPKGETGYLDFRFDTIMVSGRRFFNAREYIKTDFQPYQSRREIILLYQIFDRNKDQKELVVTDEMLKQNNVTFEDDERRKK